jgi:hypothetical protein
VSYEDQSGFDCTLVASDAANADEQFVRAVKWLLSQRSIPKVLSWPGKCDYCAKAVSTFWWVLDTRGGGDQFCLLPWDDKYSDLPGIEHICSNECVHKALRQYLNRNREVAA